MGYFFNRIIGESEPLKVIYRLIQKAAPTDATVLLRGESGCGKELFARAVHVNGPRRDQPFVKVDCAALPASLIENELFGHEKGAFTGADHRMPGKFEAADGGTVFIDEIGELPLPVQGKLLRVLQDREFERVGGTQTLKVDVRIVAATNRDLVKMVAEGKFREDLYYRIKVVELVLPPLRERGGEDIERLTRHFIAASAKRHRLPLPRLSGAALERLKRYRWPGNVRELENCIESAVVLCEGEILEEHLPLPKVVACRRLRWRPVRRRCGRWKRRAAAAGRGGEAAHPAGAGLGEGQPDGGVEGAADRPQHAGPEAEGVRHRGRGVASLPFPLGKRGGAPSPPPWQAPRTPSSMRDEPEGFYRHEVNTGPEPEVASSQTLASPPFEPDSETPAP